MLGSEWKAEVPGGEVHDSMLRTSWTRELGSAQEDLCGIYWIGRSDWTGDWVDEFLFFRILPVIRGKDGCGRVVLLCFVRGGVATFLRALLHFQIPDFVCCTI